MGRSPMTGRSIRIRGLKARPIPPGHDGSPRTGPVRPEFLQTRYTVMDRFRMVLSIQGFRV
jgi:hypothetical protein